MTIHLLDPILEMHAVSDGGYNVIVTMNDCCAMPKAMGLACAMVRDNVGLPPPNEDDVLNSIFAGFLETLAEGLRKEHIARELKERRARNRKIKAAKRENSDA
jgi:hypothetical protein